MVKVKVIYADPAPKTSKRAGVARARVASKATSGHLRTIDADSVTVSDDITQAFTRNVAKARRENRKLLGVADYAPKRG